MDDRERLRRMIQILLEEMPQYREDAKAFPQDYDSQRRLLRSLMNLCPPQSIRKDFLTLQDELLTAERLNSGIVDADTLPVCSKNDRIALWQGDITRLHATGIVNAANAGLLGCFVPCHNCIDNVIHSAAGLQLRQACAQLMWKQGHEEPTGEAKMTPAYHLPSRFVLHTVGPIVRQALTEEERALLAKCYFSCLTLAAENSMASLAFCCISTGEFGFPQQDAAEIAIQTVEDFLQTHRTPRKVIFDVFKDSDFTIYHKLLDKA
ncbi:MAG: protein-ADP-ribose hydrolase [Eubacteriales bacterium]|nr:protein-ADP-ribose hydrolase [Eubacteriales bacterium]